MHVFRGVYSILLIFICKFVNGATEEQDNLEKELVNFNGDVYSFKPTSPSYPITVYMGETTLFSFNYSVSPRDNRSPSDANSRPIISSSYAHTQLAISIDAEDKVQLLNDTMIFMKPYDHGQFVIALKGKLPGRANLFMKFDNFSRLGVASFKVYVELRERTIDVMFTSVVIMLVVVANIGMGAKVDLSVVKSELKRPIAPIIGMSSQFIIMPLIAFTLAYNLDMDPGVALGFFALGCSPGGSASNVYTYLLQGNISLSITMTLISSLASLGFLPLWLFTLGRLIYDKGDISIPYGNIIFSLIGLLAPIGIGLFLQWKFPKVAKFFIKAIKYIIVVFFIFVLSVGIYANWFIFLLINWEVIVAAACLPYLGFVFGALLAFVSRQSKANIIAIAVETGIQNTGIPIILLRLSLSGPDKDTGIITPVISALFTPIPIMIAIAYVQSKIWWKNRQKADDSEGECLDNAAMDSFTQISK